MGNVVILLILSPRLFEIQQYKNVLFEVYYYLYFLFFIILIL